MATHSSTLAWNIPWMEEPGRLQSMGSQRVRHKWATSLSLFTFMHWRRKWQPTPVLLPGESQGQRSLVGCRLWRLKWLSSSSSSSLIVEDKMHMVSSRRDILIFKNIFEKCNRVVFVVLFLVIWSIQHNLRSIYIFVLARASLFSLQNWGVVISEYLDISSTEYI